MRLAENTGSKKSPKIGISALSYNFVGQYLRNEGMYRQSEKKFVKQQYLPHTFSQYGELRPTSGCNRFFSLGHHSKFQRVSRLGKLAALLQGTPLVGVSLTAALNRGRHLYSAGRPSR